MTEEELDLLASAYLDGEATSEEVATVEADPELLARVEELRSVIGPAGAPAPPPPALKEQHLAAALAAFDNAILEDSGPFQDTTVLDGVPPAMHDRDRPNDPERPGTVTALGPRRETRSTDRPQAPSRAMPQWLPVAAAVLLIGGGAIWLAGRSGDDDAFDTAAVESAADEGGDDAADDPTASRAVAADEADALAESAPAADADTGQDAMESSDAETTNEATDDESTEDQAEEESADDSAADGEGSSQPATTTAPAAGGGFFPQEPVWSFDEVPDADQLSAADLPDFRADLSRSRCGQDYRGDSGSELVGYLPIEIAGEAAELLLVVDADGSESTIVVDETCRTLTP